MEKSVKDKRSITLGPGISAVVFHFLDLRLIAGRRSERDENAPISFARTLGRFDVLDGNEDHLAPPLLLI